MMLLGIILLLYTSTFPASAVFDVSVYELLYGDLTNLESLFFLPVNNSKKENVEPDDAEDKNRRPVGELLAKLEKSNQPFTSTGYDVEDLNSIVKDISNLTRRRWPPYPLYPGHQYDYDIDEYYYHDQVFYTERRKKMMLVMDNLQFLIHTRPKIQEACKLRQFVMKDKRYRLGYLFNRMRKLAIEQRKVAAAAEANRVEPTLNNLRTMMRMYEKVVRFDVDLRDTADLIKKVYGERAKVDQLYGLT